LGKLEFYATLQDAIKLHCFIAKRRYFDCFIPLQIKYRRCWSKFTIHSIKIVLRVRRQRNYILTQVSL